VKAFGEPRPSVDPTSGKKLYNHVDLVQLLGIVNLEAGQEVRCRKAEEHCMPCLLRGLWERLRRGSTRHTDIIATCRVEVGLRASLEPEDPAA
jgi:hypothetical protein